MAVLISTLKPNDWKVLAQDPVRSPGGWLTFRELASFGELTSTASSWHCARQ